MPTSFAMAVLLDSGGPETAEKNSSAIILFQAKEFGKVCRVVAVRECRQHRSRNLHSSQQPATLTLGIARCWYFCAYRHKFAISRLNWGQDNTVQCSSLPGYPTWPLPELDIMYSYGFINIEAHIPGVNPLVLSARVNQMAIHIKVRPVIRCLLAALTFCLHVCFP